MSVADPGFCMGGWPDGLKKILKIKCPRLAKNAFLAIERSQISSKISAVCKRYCIINNNRDLSS